MFGDYGEIQRIKKLLENFPAGLSISEISQELLLHRTTVAKYLDILQMKGEVALKIRGTSKMYLLSNRIPASAIRNLHDGAYIFLDTNLSVAEISEDLTDTLNIREDISGRNIADQTLAVLRDGKLEKRCREALSGQFSEMNIAPIIKKDQRHFQIRILPIVFDDGKTGCSLLIKDCTDFRIAAFNAEMCEKELVALSRDLNEFMFKCTPEGVLTRVNPQFCARLDKKPEELIGFPYEPVISHEDIEHLSRMKKEITPATPVRLITFRSIQPDGMVTWEEWTYRGLFSDDGVLTGFLVVGRDISEQQHLKEQLDTFHASFEALVKQRTREMRQTNQDLLSEISRRERIERELLIIQSAFDNASDSIILFERSGKVWRGNETSCRLLGYTKDEISTITVFSINPEFTEDSWDRLWEKSEKGPKIIMTKSIHKRKDEVIIPVEVSRTFIQAGPVKLFCSIARERIPHDKKKTSGKNKGI